jgi:hypothetical protein
MHCNKEAREKERKKEKKKRTMVGEKVRALSKGKEREIW